MNKLTVSPNGVNSLTRQLNQALGDLRRRFGPDVIRPASDLSPVTVIPTGFESLDQALGIGGLPRGRIVNIWGPESSGKTTLCLHVIAEAQKAGQGAAFVDAEHKLDPVWARQRGVDISRLLVVRPESGEIALEMADVLIHSGAFGVVVVDSTAALVPRAELESEMGDKHCHHGAIMSQAMRKLVGAVSRTDTLLIFTSQLRKNVGVMFGSPEAVTGGTALRFYAAVGIDLRRIQALKDRDEVIGSRVRAVVKKNQVGPAFRQAEFDIYFDSRDVSSGR